MLLQYLEKQMTGSAFGEANITRKEAWSHRNFVSSKLSAMFCSIALALMEFFISRFALPL